MFKILLGVALVIGLVATGFISGGDIQQAGDAVAAFVKHDAREVINTAANAVKDATDEGVLDAAQRKVKEVTQ